MHLLLLPLAAAGGGSSGFGGGGGGGFGGGGGGFGGGGGGFGNGSGGFAAPAGAWLVPVIFIIVIGGIALLGLWQTWSYNRRRKARVAQVRLAAAEAAEDDPLFDPDTVVPAATQLFTDMQGAWDARDRDRLRALCSPDLLVEWTRRLDDFERRGWHNRVRLLAQPIVEYVGLVNREGTDDDRVVVRIEARLDDYVETRDGHRINHNGQSSAATLLCEYWTLAQRDGGWYLLSIEQKAEGDHQLDAEIVASPWADRRVEDQSLVELAAADAAPDDVKTAEIADPDFDGDAGAAALDLSLADGRFAPDVLEIAVRRAVEAWAEAIDGPDTALEGIATPEAMDVLLYAGDASRRTRVVVRGPRVTGLHITALDAAHEPPQMHVRIEVEGARYVEDRDTVAVVAGAKDRRARFTEDWTFGLDTQHDEQPWRVVDAAGTKVA